MQMARNKDIYLKYLIPLGLFSIAFFWKFTYISSRDICLDEPFTIFNAQKSITDILAIPKQGPNVPLFMLILHFWIKLFGIGPVAIRILPLLFNSLTAVYLYKTGRKFFNIWAALLASGMFILSSYHFYFGLEARSYALMTFLTTTALYSFLSFLREPRKRIYVVSLILSNTLLIYSHYFGWFIIFIQISVCFFYIKNGTIIKQMLIVLLVTGAVFSPYAVIFIKQFLASSQGTWVQPPANSEYLNQIKFFLNGPLVLKICFWVTIAGILFTLYIRRWNKKIKEFAITGLWWFLPFTIMFLVSSKVPMFINRYILFTSVGLYLSIGALIWYLFQHNKYLSVVAITVILLFTAYKLEINSKQFYYREVKNAVNKVKQQENGNSIVLIHPHWANLGFAYYYSPEIFKDVYNFDKRLEEVFVYPVWNKDYAKQAVEENQGKKVIYYQDGSLFMDPLNSIFNYLDTTFVRSDSVFYPQCFYVSSFE